MQKAVLYITFSILLFLSSCILLNESDSFKNSEPLTDKAQQTIIRNIEAAIGKNFSYESFYFSKIVQHKPKEILELEALFKEKDELHTRRYELGSAGIRKRTVEIDSLIELKKTEIRDNNIHSVYSMDHIFSLIDSAGGTETVMEAKYYMNHTLDSVISIDVSINAPLPSELKGSFESFFFEDPLHYSDDFYADQSSDASFYNFFKARLSEIDDVETKSAFLVHTLSITQLTKKNKKYLPDQFGLLIANEFIKRNYGDDYKSTSRVSPFYSQLDENDNLLGYELYLEVEFSEEGQHVCFYINFNPWIEIINVELVPPPYEDYFSL